MKRHSQTKETRNKINDISSDELESIIDRYLSQFWDGKIDDHQMLNRVISEATAPLHEKIAEQQKEIERLKHIIHISPSMDDITFKD